MDAIEITRRKQLLELAKADEEYLAMEEEFLRAKEAFDQYCDQLPLEQRNMLQSYPGMGYLMHHRMLTLACRYMQFPECDEEWEGQ